MYDMLLTTQTKLLPYIDYCDPSSVFTSVACGLSATPQFSSVTVSNLISFIHTANSSPIPPKGIRTSQMTRIDSEKAVVTDVCNGSDL
jgi:hypothetical protein